MQLQGPTNLSLLGTVLGAQTGWRQLEVTALSAYGGH